MDLALLQMTFKIELLDLTYTKKHGLLNHPQGFVLFKLPSIHTSNILMLLTKLKPHWSGRHLVPAGTGAGGCRWPW